MLCIQFQYTLRLLCFILFTKISRKVFDSSRTVSHTVLRSHTHTKTAIKAVFVCVCADGDDIRTRSNPSECEEPQLCEYLAYIKRACGVRDPAFMKLLDQVRTISEMMDGSVPARSPRLPPGPVRVARTSSKGRGIDPLLRQVRRLRRNPGDAGESAPPPLH